MYKRQVMGNEEPEEPQTPEEAQAVIDLIDQIGTVTLENREAIEAARNAYDALTEEQQSLSLIHIYPSADVQRGFLCEKICDTL